MKVNDAWFQCHIDNLLLSCYSMQFDLDNWRNSPKWTLAPDGAFCSVQRKESNKYELFVSQSGVAERL